MAPISTLTVKLQAQIAEFQGEFREAQKEVQKFHDNFETTATKASAMGNLIAIGAEHAVRAIASMGREILESASHIKDLSSRTGLAVETIQRFQYVAGQTGTTVDAFADAAFRLSANIAGGGRGVVAAVEALGLSFDDLKRQSPDKQFEIVAEALGKVENAGEKTRLGLILMERSFKPIAASIAEGYKKMADEAEIAGRRQIDAIDEAGDAWARFRTNTTTIVTNLAGSLILNFEEVEAALDKFDIRFGALRLLLPGNTTAVLGFADALRQVKEEANNLDLSKVVSEMQRVALMTLKDTGTGGLPVLQVGTAEYRAAEAELMAQNREWNRQLEESRKKADEYAGALKRIREAAIPLTETQKDEVDRLRLLNIEYGDMAIKLKVSETAIQNYAKEQDKFADESLKGVSDAIKGVEERITDLGVVFEQDLSESLKSLVEDIEAVEDKITDVGEAFEKDLVDVLKFVASEIEGVEQRVNDIEFTPNKRIQQLEQDFKDIGLRGARTLAEGIAEGIRSGDWGAVGQAFEDAMGEAMASGMAAAVNFFVPGLGDALKPIFDAISSKITSAFDFNEGRDLVQDFAKSFGGFDALHARLLEMGAAGEALWIKLTQGVGRDNPEQARRVIDEIKEALEEFGTEAERAAARMDAIGVAMDGVNTKATLFAAPFQALIDKQKEGKITQDEFTASLAALGEKGQAEFERIGLFAAAAFAGMVKETGDAIGALDRLGPALGILKQGVTDFGLTSTGTIDALVGLFDLVHDQTTGPILQAIQATGQIFAGLQDAGILTSELFQTVSDDIGAAFRELEAKGGDVAKAMALSQPVLQRLWEAQKTYGRVTDETTQKILDQAEQQGLVGDHMKDVNKQILDVLIAIADVFGAKIPEGMRSTRDAATDTARTIEDEFSKIKVPIIKIPFEWEGDQPPTRDRTPSVPHMAHGGLVRRPTLALIGEAGPEVVIPLSKLGSFAPDAGSTTVEIHMDGRDVADIVVPHLPGKIRRLVRV